ncbi:MAG TPA: hypothetical protein VF306_08675 [Pirellulales bacterium]
MREQRTSLDKRPWLWAALVSVAAAGCSHRSAGHERYVPAAALARDALDQVLSAWKDGKAAGPLASQSAPITIQVADATRKPGQRLVDYDLLGEISGEGPRTFVVRLKLDNPAAQLEAVYYLVGIDPLWVFRQEDYDALIHWSACAADDENAPETFDPRTASMVESASRGDSSAR